MYKIIIILIFWNGGVCSEFLDLRRPGVPVPHAEELHTILSKSILNNSEFDSNSFISIFGSDAQEVQNNDNLDIKVLDYDTIRKIADKMKTLHVNNRNKLNEMNSRRFNFKAPLGNKDYYFYFISMDLSLQYIYHTRRRLQDSKKYRDPFKDNVQFNIGLMFGALFHIRKRMRSYFVTISKLQKKTHFLWFFLLYERVLTCHVDITNMCDKIYVEHAKWLKEKKTQAKKDSNIGKK